MGEPLYQYTNRINSTDPGKRRRSADFRTGRSRNCEDNNSFYLTDGSETILTFESLKHRQYK